jgi:hypothetical protein
MGCYLSFDTSHGIPEMTSVWLEWPMLTSTAMCRRCAGLELLMYPLCCPVGACVGLGNQSITEFVVSLKTLFLLNEIRIKRRRLKKKTYVSV